MADQTPEENPTDGVSKKLKVFVITLTAFIFIALVALFTKLANKPDTSTKIPSTASLSNQSLSDEYNVVGTRLMNSGLTEQAIDQFIMVWKIQKIGSLERAKAAYTIGRLYAGLGNCQESLIWLFRAEVVDSTLPLQTTIDSCLAKIRSIHSGQ
jgi:hypothetical protein